MVEGVNHQVTAKTALHTVEGYCMENAPLGTMTRLVGLCCWCTRSINGCTRWVYSPHQWLIQGCSVVDSGNERIGAPLNDKGGGGLRVGMGPGEPPHS